MKAAAHNTVLVSLLVSLFAIGIQAADAAQPSGTPSSMAAVAAVQCQLQAKACPTWVVPSSVVATTASGQKISAFLWKYNQTWNYGFTSGGQYYTVGQVQLVANVNMNGRQAQWTQSIAPFSGPPVNGGNLWNCVKDTVFDSSCSGGWHAPARGAFSNATYESKDYPYLSDNGNYRFDFQWGWQAQGWPYLWSSSQLSTNQIVCKTRTAPCQF